MEFRLNEYLTTKRDEKIFIWLCNIGAEKYWHKVSKGVADRKEERIVSHMEEINILIARRQDYVILREKPDEVYLDTLEEYGFDIPNILVVDNDNSDSTVSISELLLKDKELIARLKAIGENQKEVYFIPYGFTEQEKDICSICNLRTIYQSVESAIKINDKVFARNMCKELDLNYTKGCICNSVEEIEKAFCELTTQSGFDKIILKEPYDASGKGLYIITDSKELKRAINIVRRNIKKGLCNTWIVEGWYDKKCDINYQIYIDKDGNVELFSIKEQVVNKTIYIGSRIPANIKDDTIKKYYEYAKRIARYLSEQGYSGVAGIDSFITKDGTIMPCIEVNGRFTLSTYLSYLNNVLGDMKIFSRYFRIVSDKSIAYKDIVSFFKRQGILYDTKKREGVICYTSATLPNHKTENNQYYGRLFLLVIGATWDRVEQLNALIVDTIQHKIGKVLN